MCGKFLLIALLTALNVPAIANADGGAIRLCAVRDSHRITVFTSPTPLSAGQVDVSVLVQDVDSGKPRTDVPMVVSVYPIHDPRQSVSVPATTEAATNKLLRAAQVKLYVPGSWRIEVAVDGIQQGQPFTFDVEAGEASPPWLAIGLWISWPLLAIMLFAVHQYLVHRRRLCSGQK